jgi:hypothetical protein
MHPVWPSDNCITLLEIRCPTISLREVGPVHAGVHVRARVAVIDRIPPRILGAGELFRVLNQVDDGKTCILNRLRKACLYEYLRKGVATTSS